jgi:hypothetical protein
MQLNFRMVMTDDVCAKRAVPTVDYMLHCPVIRWYICPGEQHMHITSGVLANMSLRCVILELMALMTII